MRILYINDATSSSNWGDRASSTSLRQRIAEAGGDVVFAFTERQLIRVEFGAQLASHDQPRSSRWREAVHGLTPPVAARLGTRIWRRFGPAVGKRLVPIRWADFSRAADNVLRKDGPWSGLLHALERVDAVLIHGDGSMVGNGMHPRVMLVIAYVAIEHFGLPVSIVNHTADFSHPLLLEMAEHVYPRLHDVVFRDPISVERCASFCRGRYVPDTAFSYAPADRDAWLSVVGRRGYFDVWPDVARFDPDRPYVCVGGSSLLGSREVIEIRRQYARLLEHLRDIYGGQIVLTASDLVDERIFRPLAATLDMPLIGVRTPVQQAVDLLGQADAYIGGRWHPSIFAARGGTPFVALSGKTFKMQAIAQAAGLPASPHDALRVGDQREAITSELMVLLAAGTTLRERLRRWGEEQASRSVGHVAGLATKETVDS